MSHDFIRCVRLEIRVLTHKPLEVVKYFTSETSVL